MNIFKMSKRKAKFIAAFLCVCLIVGLSINQSGLIRFTVAEDVWNGTLPSASATGFSGGTGTNKSPYIIATGADLAQLAANVNAGMYNSTIYVQLQSDINLANNAWLPIGNAANPFTGVFIGNGHSIKNMNITIGVSPVGNSDIGLFGYMKNSTVSDLSVTGTISQNELSKSGTSVGAIAGRAETTSITNCQFQGSIAGDKYVGGLIGTCEGTNASHCTISKCRVLENSSVTSTYYAAGGLIGYVPLYTDIMNSFNRAEVTLAVGAPQDTEAAAAAGIVGATGTGFAQIINCYNTGNITSNYIAGGIVNGKQLTVKNCYSAATVKGNASTEVIGGISGTGSDSSKGNSFSRCFYLSTGAASAFPGSMNGASENIGSFSDNSTFRYLVKEVSLSDKDWTIGTQTTLLDALSDGASVWVSTYAGMLEWGYDNTSDIVINKGYPIFTTSTAHTHDRKGEQETLKKVSCTEDGSIRYTCSVCGHPEIVTIPKTGHNYQEKIITSPTCTTSGESAKVCINEGCTSQLESWETAPMGHRWSTTKVTKEATCTETGYERFECQNAGCTEVKDEVIIPALGHNLPEMPQVIAPTCTEDEIQIFDCSRCEYSDIRVITGSALGHDWDNVDGVHVPSTCVQQGGMVRTCQRCQEAEFTDDKRDELAPHTYEETVIAPTCEEKGYTHKVCSVCKIEIDDTYVEPLGHQCTKVVTPPTCNEKGYTTHTCQRPGCKYGTNGKAYTYIDSYVDATGKHRYVKDENRSFARPNCLSEGQDVYVCELCHAESATIVETIPALAEHTFIFNEEGSVKQTCTAGGFDLYICKICLEEKRENETYKGFIHNYEETVHSPSCLDDGYTEFVCSNCQDTYIDDRVTALGHDYLEEVVPATTTTRGYTLYSCSRCDNSYESDYIAAIPNAYYDIATETLYLSEVDELMHYSLDGGVSWEAVEVSAVAVTASAINTELGIMVKRPGNDVLPLADSEIQTITITKPVMPDNILPVQPSNDRPGMIVGVDSTMEYRMQGDEEWIPVESEMIEGLQAGIYEIRIKATESTLASDILTIEIKETEPEPTETPDIVTETPAVSETPDVSSTPDVDVSATPTGTPGVETPTPTKTPEAEKPTPSKTPDVETPTPTKTPDIELPKPSASAESSATPEADKTQEPSKTPENGSIGDGNSGNGNQNANGSDGTISGTDSGNNFSGNGSGTNTKNDVATATPGVVGNTIYYSPNGGATGAGTTTVTKTNTTKGYTAAKTGDDSNIAVWLVIIATAASAVVVTRMKKVEQ